MTLRHDYSEGPGSGGEREPNGGPVMTFDDVLEQVIQLLQHQRRVSYRALKRRFALDDDYLEDLKEELIHAQRVATDEDGRILISSGELRRPQSPVPPPPNPA